MARLLAKRSSFFREIDDDGLPRVKLPEGELVVEIQHDEQFIARPFSSRGHSRKLGSADVVGKTNDENSTNPDEMAKQRAGFCIYIDTLCQGPVPTVSDDERYVVFESEREAQREIADFMMTRVQQFMDGERDFEDATMVEEYVVPVNVGIDGTITDGNGKCFGPMVE